MLPKEYYEKNTIPKENNYVFTLFPSELEEQYLEYIKKPLDSINTDKGNVICESYLNFLPGVQVMPEIWKGIAKANVVIADITYFKPNVMYELGVALMNKESVYIVANKKLNASTQKSLPYDLSHTKVMFYDDDSLDKLSSGLVDYIGSKIENIESIDIIDAEVLRLMSDAKDLMRSNKADTAVLLFKEMDSKEPSNWYIHQEWGNAYVKNKDYKKANEKYLSAIDNAKSDRQKALVYIDLAQMYRISKQENDALVAFGKAENLDRSNADLFDKWAYLYYLMGNFQEASNKMVVAVRLKGIKEYQLKSQYYHERLIKPEFNMKLGQWIKINLGEQIKTTPPIKFPIPIKRMGSTNKDFGEKKSSYVKFTKQFGIGNIANGEIANIDTRYGVFVKFNESGATGLIHHSLLPKFFDMKDEYKIGKSVNVKVIRLIDQKYNINLELA